MSVKEKISKDIICQVFIDSIHHFFLEQSNIAANVNLPYILNNTEKIVDDLAAYISISGSRKGFVYVLGPEDLFVSMIELLIGMNYVSKERIKDLAGDLANTISGNARKVFGSDFVISVPKVMSEPKKMSFPTVNPTIAIPVKWQNYMLNVVIGLE